MLYILTFILGAVIGVMVSKELLHTSDSIIEEEFKKEFGTTIEEVVDKLYEDLNKSKRA